jgi:hypothetical protein
LQTVALVAGPRLGLRHVAITIPSSLNNKKKDLYLQMVQSLMIIPKK